MILGSSRAFITFKPQLVGMKKGAICILIMRKNAKRVNGGFFMSDEKLNQSKGNNTAFVFYLC